MRKIVLILILLISTNAIADMYMWKENGHTQMRSVAPPCYINPTSKCPVVEVYRNGQLISSSKTEIDLEKRKEIAGIRPVNKNVKQGNEIQPTAPRENPAPVVESTYRNAQPEQSQRCKDMAAEADALMKRDNKDGAEAVGTAMVANGIYARYERQCLGIVRPQQESAFKQVDQGCISKCLNDGSAYQFCAKKCSY